MNIAHPVITPTALGRELRRVRRSRKMSQTALTIAANIALPTVKKLEAGGGTVASLMAAMAALDHRFSTQNPGEDLGRWLVREA